MEMVVEDGTGMPTANCYVSVETADEILSVNPHSNWSIVDFDTKGKLLMWATRILDQRVEWYGRKMHGTGWTAWPRCGARDREGFAIDDNVVPRQVQIACALLADHLLTGNPELVNTSSNLKSLQVDVIELQFDTNKAPDKYPVEIKLVLSGLGRINMGRGGPKFIVMH
jgi:hypothetical protein